MDSNEADQYARLAMDCHQRGELDQAIGYYQKLLAIKPGFAQVHYNLGIAFAALGRLEEAAASYRQAISCKPDYAAACNNLGVTLKAQGQLEAAVQHYAQAITLQPDFADAFAARMAGSLLHAVGLPELITNSVEGYENRAFKLAASPELLTDIRSKLDEKRRASALFDTGRFCRHLEAAYLALHDRAARGELPACLIVSSSN